MRQESKFGLTFLHAYESKKLRKKNGTVLYGVVALSKHDSIDNYEEVDELWSPDTIEIDVTDDNIDLDTDISNIIPDENGNISYEDAKKLIDELTTVKKRILNLQKTNTEILKVIEDIKSFVQFINK